MPLAAPTSASWAASEALYSCRKLLANLLPSRPFSCWPCSSRRSPPPGVVTGILTSLGLQCRNHICDQPSGLEERGAALSERITDAVWAASCALLREWCLRARSCSIRTASKSARSSPEAFRALSTDLQEGGNHACCFLTALLCLRRCLQLLVTTLAFALNSCAFVTPVCCRLPFTLISEANSSDAALRFPSALAFLAERSP